MKPVWKLRVPMKRMIMDQLIERKNRTDRKPMLLTGARQCGKPWVRERAV